MSVSELELNLISPSPLNPRKTFDQVKLQELAEDIKLRGVLQNIVVRLKSKTMRRFEIVVGERRYRASVLAGLETIPASVVEMNDQLALETMIVENAKRVDVDPVEEADGYRQLLDHHQLSVDDIALRVGRSRSAVYARLKLCDLCDAGRKQLTEGRLTASTALLIARIPNVKLQKEAVREVAETRNKNADPMSARRAADYIQRHFMLRLSDANWSLVDEDLIPSAGSCAKCPKRTGNQAELFEDVKGADVCIDPPCFENKHKAHAKARVAAGKKAGATILSGVASKKIIHKSWTGADPSIRYGADHVGLEQNCDQDPKRRSYKTLLKPGPGDITFATAFGETFELLPKKGLASKLKAAGHKFAQSGQKAASSWEKQDAARRRTEKTQTAKRNESDRRCLEIINLHEIKSVDACLAQGVDLRPTMFYLATSFGEHLWDSSGPICAVLGLEVKKDQQTKAIEKWIQEKARTGGELAGLVSMIAATDRRHSGWKEAEALYGFDRKSIETAVSSDVKRLKVKKAPKKRAKKKAAKKSKKKAGKKKAAKRKPRKVVDV